MADLITQGREVLRNERIKFRAWDKLRNEYLSAGTVSIEIHRGNNPIITNKLDGIVDITNNSRFILEQYTGLKDKKGKKIYEGDIVKVNNGYDTIGEIYFDEGSYEIGRKSMLELPLMYGMCEIIGNIHENKE